MRQIFRSPVSVAAIALGGSLFCSSAIPQDARLRLIAGAWDQIGSLVQFEIRPDGNVFHSTLGKGTIKHDAGDLFYVEYPHKFMICRYLIRQYGASELSVAKANQTDPTDCDFGTTPLRKGNRESIPPARIEPSAKGTKSSRTKSGDAASGALVKAATKKPEVATPSGLAVSGAPALAEYGDVKSEGVWAVTQRATNKWCQVRGGQFQIPLAGSVATDGGVRFTRTSGASGRPIVYTGSLLGESGSGSYYVVGGKCKGVFTIKKVG